MIRFYLTIALIGGFFWAQAQQSLVDSIERELLTETDPKTLLNLKYDLAFELMNREPERMRQLAEEIIEEAPRHQLLSELAYGQNLLADYHRMVSEYPQAIEAYEASFLAFEKLGDTMRMGYTLRQLGQCYSEQDRSSEAMDHYLRSLSIAQMLKDSLEMARVYSLVGELYHNTDQLDEALKYAFLALDIRQRLGDEKKLSYSYSFLGNIYSDMGDFEKSLEYLQKDLAISRKYESLTGIGLALNNIGYTYLDWGKPELALAYFSEAVEPLQQLGNDYFLANVYNNLGRVYNTLGRFAEAKAQALRALPHAEATTSQTLRKSAYGVLAEAAAGLGNYRNAYEYFQLHSALKDTIAEQDRFEEMAALENKYRHEESEKALARKELELARQSNRQKNLLIAAILAILLVGGTLLYLRQRDRLRKKEAELALQLQHNEAEKLREMDRLKSTFFANISHEFRTPLSLIISPVEQMLEGSLKGDRQKYLRIIRRNAGRLLTLVNDLLDLSKLESGNTRLQVNEGDLTRFTRSIGFAFESLARRKQIDYRVAVSEQPLSAWFDPVVLEKILNNLLSNAFKYTHDGGWIQLELKVATDGNDVEISVADNGIGIPPDQAAHIFDRFYRIRRSEQSTFGTGIGLALTKELVELHHGRIELSSRENEGSSFSITLPISSNAYPAVEQATEPVLHELPSRQAPKPLALTEEDQKPADQRHVVLVVEDNDDLRNYVREQLAGDFQVLEAINGREGLSLAQERLPDVIVTDLMMPEMDGVELCREVRENPLSSHIPIVMLTAKAEQEDKLLGLETGADAYLAKPFETRELIVRIRALIERQERLQKKFSGERVFKPSEVAVTSLDEQFLHGVLQAIEQNLDEESFSVVELAQAASMSRSQLHRKLKALTGKSPNELIREMRLQRARELLEKGAGNASEVAFRVGFNSLAYFSKCFSDFFGLLPSEVRQKRSP